jgi:uncharacterized membrane protein
MPLLTLSAVVSTLLGSAIIAGVFFAFSNFVMPALGRLPAVEGIVSMQAINVVVINPLFMAVFAGTAVLSLLVALLALRLATPFKSMRRSATTRVM